jgi:Zn finger protein HypA/HybF involved in hydrogenase expression
MHELHLMKQIVEAVEARLHELPGAKAVVVRLKVAGHSHMVDDPASLQTAFRLAATGTGVAGAALEIVPVRGESEGWCPHCLRRAAAAQLDAPCPNCGRGLRPAEEGPELMVHELVVEE